VGGVYQGYITTTKNIFAANPVFTSVQVDSNADLLLPFGYNPDGPTVTSARSDFIGIYMMPRERLGPTFTRTFATHHWLGIRMSTFPAFHNMQAQKGCDD
jgi:hypothetical protein